MKRNVLCCKWCAEWIVTCVYLHMKFNQILCLPRGFYSLENKNISIALAHSFISVLYSHLVKHRGDLLLPGELWKKNTPLKWKVKECKAVDLHCFATWAKEKKICSSKTVNVFLTVSHLCLTQSLFKLQTDWIYFYF